MSGFGHPRPHGFDTTPKRCAASERPVLLLPRMTPEYPKKTLKPFEGVLNRLETRCGKPQFNASKLSPGNIARATRVLKSHRSDPFPARSDRQRPPNSPKGAYQVLPPATTSCESANRIAFRRGQTGQSWDRLAASRPPLGTAASLYSRTGESKQKIVLISLHIGCAKGSSEPYFRDSLHFGVPAPQKIHSLFHRSRKMLFAAFSGRFS